MSTTLNDLKGGTSKCCGAQMYQDYGICSDCKEHSEEVKEIEVMKKKIHEEQCATEGVKCEYCQDTGIIERHGDDGRGGWDKVGEKRCVCTED